MTKYFLHIVFVALCFASFGQKGNSGSVKKSWSNIRKTISYQPSTKHKGPKNNNYNGPASMSQGSSNPSNYNSSSGPVKSYSGTPLSQRQVQGGKTLPQNPGKKGTGTLEKDPNIVPSEPIDFPESDPSSSSSSSMPEVNTGSEEFWKWLGIIILVLLVVYIIYMIVKNHQPTEKSIPFEPLVEDLNPEMISKTELELRLDEALTQGNYKECVRIYFLFAMKELMSRRLVYWKKEKTNMHYIIEMQGKQGVDFFEQIVGFYDIVWYGDYSIDQQAYLSMQPKLESAYKNLEALK